MVEMCIFTGSIMTLWVSYVLRQVKKDWNRLPDYKE